MPRPLRVLGLSGSLRRDSLNARLLALAALQLPDTVEYRRYDGLKAVPPFDEDDEREPLPASVVALREQIAWADGLIVATPEYNASIPGQLKNAVDWASRPVATAALRERCAVVIGASSSPFGAVWAQTHLRSSLGIAGARVLENEVAVGEAAEQFSSDGALLDPDLAAQLTAAIRDLLTELQVATAVSP